MFLHIKTRLELKKQLSGIHYALFFTGFSFSLNSSYEMSNEKTYKL